MPRHSSEEIQTQWAAFEAIIDEDFLAHLRKSQRHFDYWDFKLVRANCPSEIGIKLRRSRPEYVDIYFDRGNHKDEHSGNLETFSGKLKDAGFEFTAQGEFYRRRDQMRLIPFLSLTFSIKAPRNVQDDNAQTMLKWQRDACIRLAELLEKMYGIKGT